MGFGNCGRMFLEQCEALKLVVTYCLNGIYSK
jgi:hypothetical protein